MLDAYGHSLQLGDAISIPGQIIAVLQGSEKGLVLRTIGTNEQLGPDPLTEDWLQEQRALRTESRRVVAIYNQEKDQEYYWTIGTQIPPLGAGFTSDELRNGSYLEQSIGCYDCQKWTDWRLFDKKGNIIRQYRHLKQLRLEKTQ